MKFSQSPLPSPWTEQFHIYTKDCDKADNGRLIFLQWCTEQFGENGNTFHPIDTKARWSCISGSLNCYVMFKDASDAMLFKLTWDNVKS